MILFSENLPSLPSYDCSIFFHYFPFLVALPILLTFLYHLMQPILGKPYPVLQKVGSMDIYT